MKKALSILLAMVLLLTCIPLGAISVSAETSGDYMYTVTSGMATITGYTGNGGAITIPTKVGGYPVAAIGQEAFYWCSTATSITIPKGIVSIGARAFCGCEKVPSVTIPSSVTSIGDQAFDFCFNLANIQVDKGNTAYSSENGVLFNKKKTKIVIFPMGKKGSYTIPNSIKKIDDFTFYWCNLTSVTIPDSVTEIGEWAFKESRKLKTVVIGNGVKSIGEEAFDGCKELTSVTLGNRVATIGSYAFSSCEKLTSLSIPVSVTKIGEGVVWFSEKLTSIYYAGTKSQAKSIKIDKGNEDLISATWHYNSCNNKSAHSYKTVTKKATATANGYTVKRCSVCKKETGKTTIYKASSIKLAKTAYTYNGKAQKPAVTIKNSKGQKIATSNYTVTYATGRKNVGTYKVTIKFKGKYTGTKVLTFKINPVKTTVSKVTAAKKKLTINVAKKTTQVTGYEIQYATNKSFKSAKTKTLTNYKKTSLSLSGLKTKTTYYIRVRTYKTVNGKKVYSGWSTIKYKKTK